jgi:predicted ATPase
MRQGLAAFQATGAKQLLPFFSCELAWAHGRAGRLDDGLTLLAEAQAMMGTTGERLYEAESYRLAGELLLQKFQVPSSKFQVHKCLKSKVQSPKLQTPNTRPLAPSAQAGVEREAEGCFQKAVATARRQKAKSLELRAAMSLSRLWQRQEKKQQAHNLLSGIYHWFTEGFTTADLREAKALLEELA